MQLQVGTKRESVVNRLREALTGGHYRPGERLSERELATLLGVSRTPVREALRLLEQEGLVVSRPGHGLRVAPVSVDRAHQLYQVRVPLEVLAVRLVTERAGQADLEAIGAAIDEGRRAWEAQDLPRLIRANRRFHRLIAAESGNPFLERILVSLQGHVGLMMATSLTRPNRPAQTLREHSAIFERMRAGDVQGATEACQRHLANALQAALDRLREAFSTGFAEEAGP